MHEVQERSRNQGRQGSHNEERNESHERPLRHLRNKSFQDSWKSQIRLFIIIFIFELYLYITYILNL